ncbi:MAG: hypothetical protein MUF45_12400 [Spirosomaceae bacterium]|jgi:hypothetical protein|nr:hypothetical protein [Spirosomataceae bacterium]
MKNLSKLFVFALFITLNACTKADDTPDPTTMIVNKWWCDSNGKLASQFFKSDGTWEQGSKTGGANNDKGNWSLSSDKKKILITNVIGKYQTLKNWEYELTTSTETNLELNYKTFGIKMSMVVCK